MCVFTKVSFIVNEKAYKFTLFILIEKEIGDVYSLKLTFESKFILKSPG